MIDMIYCGFHHHFVLASDDDARDACPFDLCEIGPTGNPAPVHCLSY
jgi:hypothetical protein